MKKWRLAVVLLHGLGVNFGCEDDEPYEPCEVVDASPLPPDAGPIIDFGCSEDVEDRLRN
jgi:hypothetical protein